MEEKPPSMSGRVASKFMLKSFRRKNISRNEKHEEDPKVVETKGGNLFGVRLEIKNKLNRKCQWKFCQNSDTPAILFYEVEASLLLIIFAFN